MINYFRKDRCVLYLVGRLWNTKLTCNVRLPEVLFLSDTKNYNNVAIAIVSSM